MPSTQPRACVWFKTLTAWCVLDGSEASEAEHRAAIAYASDYLPLDGLRRHGKFWLEPGPQERLSGSRDVVPPFGTCR